MTQEHDITNAYIDILREFVSAAMVKCVCERLRASKIECVINSMELLVLVF